MNHNVPLEPSRRPYPSLLLRYNGPSRRPPFTDVPARPNEVEDLKSLLAFLQDLALCVDHQPSCTTTVNQPNFRAHCCRLTWKPSPEGCSPSESAHQIARRSSLHLRSGPTPCTSGCLPILLPQKVPFTSTLCSPCPPHLPSSQVRPHLGSIYYSKPHAPARFIPHQHVHFSPSDI
jgi:hypothetical protein